MDARIVFNDKTEMTVEQNGSCFVLDEKPAFPDDLSAITIVSNEETIFLNNCKVQECASTDGRYWFTLIPETKEEKNIRELKEQNEMLTECLLEISEIIYGE